MYPKDNALKNAQDKKEREMLNLGTGKKYSEISVHLQSELKDVAEISVGHSKNGRRPVENESVYFKELVDKQVMSLRIGNHIMDVREYYKHSQGKSLSQKKYGVLALIFHGVLESTTPGNPIEFDFMKCGVIGVERKDLANYMRSFYIQMYHYRPGFIDDDKLNNLTEKIRKWFRENGDNAFQNPFINDSEVFQSYIYGKIMFVTKEQAKKLKLKKKQTSESATSSSIISYTKLADVRIIDEGNKDAGEIILVVLKQSETIVDDGIDFDEDEYYKRLSQLFFGQ